MFGGWDTPICYNDMYMLDLGNHTQPTCKQRILQTLLKHIKICIMFLCFSGFMEFSAVKTSGKAPSPRRYTTNHMHTLHVASYYMCLLEESLKQEIQRSAIYGSYLEYITVSFQLAWQCRAVGHKVPDPWWLQRKQRPQRRLYL